MKEKQKSQTPQYGRSSMVSYFLRGSVHFFILSILSSFIVTLAEMFMPQVVRFMVDIVLGADPTQKVNTVGKVMLSFGGLDYLKARIWLFAVVLVVIALIAAVFRYLVNIMINKGTQTLMERIRNLLFAHIQRLPFAWHMQNKTGDIIQRCTSDVDRVCVFISEQMVSLIRIIILVVMSLSFMYSMNVKLAVLATFSIPVVMLYSMYFHNKIGSRFEECDIQEGVLSTIAQENLTGVRVVRAFGREKFEKDRFEAQNQKYAGLWVRLMNLMALFWSSGDFISGLQVMLVLVFGTVLCVRGEISTGTFIAFISYNSMLTWPVRQLGRVISEMSKAGVSIDRIIYIMNSAEEQDKPNAVEADMHGDIEYSHVSFGYEENVPVVEDVSFRIKAGTTFGILGGTGSGKSTLMLLLDRLYNLKPDQGEITVGGVNIEDIKAEWLRRNIGIVLQEPFLFSRTIAENIGITQHNMPMDQIRRAARIAAVDDSINQFAKGYDTIVGERGVTLSGGQKQRTAIARMLTQQAPIMIFDDSLSAVDAETDAEIRRALKENLSGATVILISHRVTTLMGADQILVLDKGHVAELGTHEELLGIENGIYHKIYDMQMKMPEDEEVKQDE
ncbi:MAG: ABC transporter ATP-binding protein [Firmicutes bacterium]|nr:ABC transporter ATP-binding protein [Bacillota bacterium]